MLLIQEVELRRNTCEKKLVALFTFLVALCCVASQASRNLKCDFDSRMCAWANIQDSADQDDFNWRLGRGNMGQQRKTGANYDHGGDGGYMFIKSKSRGNRTAKLVSPPITKTSQTCFEFWYFMRGKTLGHLAIYTTTNRNNVTENSKLLWNLRGHQASTWLPAKIPLGPLQRTHIVIEAFDWAKGRKGNILIDDTSLKLVTPTTSCELTPSYAKPKMVDTTTTPLMTTVAMATTLGSSPESATSQVMTQHSRVGQTTQTQAVNTMINKGSSTPNPSQTKGSKNTTSSSATDLTTIKNSNQTAGGPMFVEANPHGHMVGIVVSVVLVVAVLLVALAYYVRRRKSPASMYADDCSVTMTRMYPSVTAPSDYHVDYRKLT